MEIKEDKNVWRDLLELKALTENTGAIHELQVYQLKMLARFACEGSTEIKINTEGHRATFCINVETKPTLHMLNGLDRSLKDLLGNYWSLIVENNGVAIFTSLGAKKKKRKVSDIIDRLKKQDV